MEGYKFEVDEPASWDWQVALYAKCLMAARRTLIARFGDHFIPRGARDTTVVYNRPPASRVHARVTVASDVATSTYRILDHGHILVHLEVDMLDDDGGVGSCAVAQLTFALERAPLEHQATYTPTASGADA
jgi:hypothetical protein